MPCSIILILFLASFYAITSRDLDNLAHSSLGLAASIDLSMVNKPFPSPPLSYLILSLDVMQGDWQIFLFCLL